MTDLNTEADNMLELANLYRLQAIFDKMNIITVQTNGKADSQEIIVMHDNLYRLSTIYYGDPLQWTVIADANGLIDPEITQYTRLVIPKWDGVNRGGEFVN